MKMKWIVILILLVVSSLGGYRLWDVLTEDVGQVNLVSIPVEIVTVEEEMYTNTLDYQGRVMPERLTKVSFKSGGRLATFVGEVGQELPRDYLLATLDSSDLESALESAKLQYAAAEADYDRAIKGAREEDISLALISRNKARDAVDYLKTRVADVQALFSEGIVSASELDGLELEYNLAVNDLALAQKNYEKALNGTEEEMITAAQAQKNLAQINVEAQQRLFEDASYSTKGPEVLIQKLYEVGELIPAGYPVAILRSIEQKVTLGVSSKDLDLIQLGQSVVIDKDGVLSDGTVNRIAEIPDENHFLYEVEVDLSENLYRMGDIVDIKLVINVSEVTSIPIGAIMNDGIDYVYVEENGVTVLKKIHIITVNEGTAIVDGLEVGDQLIVSNLNRIHENSLVHMKE